MKSTSLEINKKKICLFPGKFICFAFNLIGESFKSSHSVSVRLLVLVNQHKQILTSQIKACPHLFRTCMTWWKNIPSIVLSYHSASKVHFLDHTSKPLYHISPASSGFRDITTYTLLYMFWGLHLAFPFAHQCAQPAVSHVSPSTTSVLFKEQLTSGCRLMYYTPPPLRLRPH